MRIKAASLALATGLVAGLLCASAATADTPGHYVVADDSATPSVFNFTPTGVRTTITTGGSLANPEGLARVGADDYLVADKGVQTNATVDGLVVRVRNGAQSVVASAVNLVNPHGIALSADRTKAYVAGRDGRVVEVTIASGAQRLIAATGADLRGIAVEGTGSLLVADSSVPSRLLRIEPVSGATTTVFTAPAPIDLRSVLVMPNNNLVLGDQGTGAGVAGGLLTGPATGPFSHFAAGAFFANNSVPGALALDATGQVVVVDRNDASPAGGPGRIYRASLTGTVTPVVTEAGALLNEPGGLAVVPPKCGGKFATIVGTPAKDTLPGTNGPDVIVALGGKDTVKGKGGTDVICGGAGNDVLSGGGGKDTIISGKGKDRVNGGAGKDKLKCSPIDPRCG